MRLNIRSWVAAAILLVVMTSVAVAANINATVVFKSATVPANASAIVQSAGGRIVSSIPEIGVVTVTGPAEMLNSLNANGAVLTASPEIVVAAPGLKPFPMEPKAGAIVPGYFWPYQWDIKQMTHNGDSYALGAGSHNTVVGIVDTGVNTQHIDLIGNLLGGQNFTPDGPGGTVVANDIEDKNGHGSHVAGSIAGNGNILGIAPNVGFRMYRVFGASGGAPFSRIMAAAVAAANDGVDVVSMSIGGYDVIARYYWIDPDTGTVYNLGHDVADFVAARRAVSYVLSKGAVFVAAAANEGFNTSNPTNVTAYLNAAYGPQYVFIGAARETPGTLAGILTVSATGPTVTLASYSNWGQASIDVTAPGGDFQRYPAAGWYTDMCFSSYMNLGQGSPNWYSWMAGTSMATPKVAGVAALIIDRAKSQGIRLTPQQVVTKVEQTAIDIGKPGDDPYYGKGFVSAYTALQ